MKGKTHHSCFLWLVCVSSARGLSSLCVRGAAAVQDPVCPVERRGPQSLCLHSWLTLHSPVDDIPPRVTSLRKRRRQGKLGALHITGTTVATVSAASVRRRRVKRVFTSRKNAAAIRMFAFESSWWCRELERSHVSVCSSSRLCIVSPQRSIWAQQTDSACCLFTEL